MSEAEKTSVRHRRYGMVINLDKCTGCGSCMVACMAENNVTARPDETDKKKSITWMRVYSFDNGKGFPEARTCFLPRPCMHCAGKGGHGHSPCVSVCPAVATDYSAETGIVSQIPTRCFGCRYCMAACPYHARYFNWFDPVYPKGMEKMLNPDVSLRMRGVVEKCSFCFHRYQKAMDKAFYEKRKELEEGEYQTACTQSCPSGAIAFGDLDDPKHAVYRLRQPVKGLYVFRLLERLGTEPKVYYTTRHEWIRKAADRTVNDEKTAG